MYIKKIELSNFQVIENFDADFSGNVYFVTGENELGKSTLLKAIGALLTGERDDVLRNGADKGFAKMIVGDDHEEFEVQLNFTEKNPRGYLTIKQQSTGMQTDNVSMLQKIFGYQDFDAVEFSRWSETAEGRRKQIAVVKSLLPDDVSAKIDAIDACVCEMKSERTGINRDVKTFGTMVEQIAAQLEPGDVDKYAEQIDVTELMQRQQTAVALQEKAKTVYAALAQRTEQISKMGSKRADAAQKLEFARKEIEDYAKKAKEAYESTMLNVKEKTAFAERAYNEAIESLDAEQADLEIRKANAEEWLKKYEANPAKDTDVSELIASAESHNRKHALVAQYAEKRAEYNAVKDKAARIDAEISKLLSERASLIGGAKLPISGLTFTDDGLELNGVPFVPGKISDSQAMEVAAKLIIASNPKTKVFRIARGESLGAKRLQAIIDIAKRNGFQGFIEQVQRGQNEMLVEEYTEK